MVGIYLDVDKAIISENRKNRVIKPLTKSIIPKDIVFYDVETIPTETSEGTFTHYFKMCTMIHDSLNPDGSVKKRTEYVQHKVDEVFGDIMQILKGKNKLLVFAHNQNYDFVVSKMLYHFTNNGWEIEMFNPKSKAFIVKFVRKQKTIFFLDTMNYFAGSAKSLGEELKLPKLQMPKINRKYERQLKNADYDLNKVDKLCYKYYDNWYRYNIRDTEIIEKAILNLIEFIVENDYGSFSYTSASMAYSIFKHSFIKSRMHIHKDVEALTIERDSYTGGRTEIFHQGVLKNHNYYMVDFTSMYPYVMKTFKFPISLIGRLSNNSIKNAKEKMKKFGLIANVDINTDINCIPKRVNGRLSFPIGRFTATLSQPELELALKYNIVEKINIGYLYHMDYIFRDYVTQFFKLKAENKKKGNSIYAYFYKILLNSLYGKFAQRITEYKDTGMESKFQFASGFLSNEIDNEKYYTKTIDYKVYQMIKNKEVNFSMPSISSFVTSYARVHLWEAMIKAGQENVYYCDTDSLLVNKKGLNNLKPLIKDSKLGYLELQKASRTVDIRTVKDYTFAKKVKRKGVPASFKEIKPNLFQGDKFSRVNDIFVNEDFFEMQTTKTLKELTGLYTKGNVHDDGKVSPLILVKNNN